VPSFATPYDEVVSVPHAPTGSTCSHPFFASQRHVPRLVSVAGSRKLVVMYLPFLEMLVISPGVFTPRETTPVFSVQRKAGLPRP
jgi:hypothetical protein